MRHAPHLTFWLSLLIALFLQLVQLPDSLAAVRPLWLPMMLACWSLHEPRVPTLFAAFVFGIVLDVLFDAVLGQHALCFVMVTFLAIKLRGLFVVVPLRQSTIALIPAWLAYAFVMFWIDGVAKHASDPWLRWLPAASSTLFWPLVYVSVDSYLRRRQRRQDE